MATNRRRCKAYKVEELPQEFIDALEHVDLSHIDPELDKLMEEFGEEIRAAARPH